MKISDCDFSTLKSIFCTVNDAKMAKALFEAWLDENYYSKIYKEAWLDCCDEYEIDDDYYADEADEA